MTATKQRPLENLRALPGMFNEAARKRITVSALMEQEDPTEGYKGDDFMRHLDAFERALFAGGIITASNPARGIYSDHFGKFLEKNEKADIDEDSMRAAGIEYLQRVWRFAKFGGNPHSRFLVTSNLQTVSAGLRPYIEASSIEAERDLIDIPLRELIAIENRINGNSYRSVRLDETNSMFSYSKAMEGAELPRAKIALSDESTKLTKWGQALEWTYEAIFDQPIEVVAFFIRQIAIQAEYDKLTDAMETLVNDPDVITHTLSSLTGETAATTNNALNLRGLMALSMEFRRGPLMNTMLANKAQILDFLMMPVGGTAERPLAETSSTPLGAISRLGGAPQNGFSYSAVDDAPTNKLVFLDRNMALERITRVGGDISETTKFITRQTEVMTMTEYESFHVVRPSAVHIVDLTA